MVRSLSGKGEVPNDYPPLFIGLHFHAQWCTELRGSASLAPLFVIAGSTLLLFPHNKESPSLSSMSAISDVRRFAVRQASSFKFSVQGLPFSAPGKVECSSRLLLCFACSYILSRPPWVSQA